jgi:hypothetical protein
LRQHTEKSCAHDKFVLLAVHQSPRRAKISEE